MHKENIRPRPTIYIIDSDPLEAEAVSRLVAAMEAATQTFRSTEEFFESYEGGPGCIVTELRLPGQTGLELLAELNRRGETLPVIIATAFASTAITVRAIQAGAITVLDKPYSDDDMWDAIRTALAYNEQLREQQDVQGALRERFSVLTKKERQVLERVIAGKPNKTMASELEVSLRTIENRRRSIFTKLRVKSVAELVTLALRSDELEAPRLSAPGSRIFQHNAGR